MPARGKRRRGCLGKGWQGIGDGGGGRGRGWNGGYDSKRKVGCHRDTHGCNAWPGGGGADMEARTAGCQSHGEGGSIVGRLGGEGQMAGSTDTRSSESAAARHSGVGGREFSYGMPTVARSAARRRRRPSGDRSRAQRAGGRRRPACRASRMAGKGAHTPAGPGPRSRPSASQGRGGTLPWQLAPHGVRLQWLAETLAGRARMVGRGGVGRQRPTVDSDCRGWGRGSHRRVGGLWGNLTAFAVPASAPLPVAAPGGGTAACIRQTDPLYR